MLTWSLGWTGSLEPITPPASSMARLEMTSLAFMLVCVPLPVCQTLQREMVVELAVGHLAGGGRSMSSALSAGQLAEVGVDQGGRLFQDAEGADEGRRHACRRRWRNGAGSGRSGRPSSGRRGPRSRPCCRSRHGRHRSWPTPLLSPLVSALGKAPPARPPADRAAVVRAVATTRRPAACLPVEEVVLTRQTNGAVSSGARGRKRVVSGARPAPSLATLAGPYQGSSPRALAVTGHLEDGRQALETRMPKRPGQPLLADRPFPQVLVPIAVHAEDHFER